MDDEVTAELARELFGELDFDPHELRARYRAERDKRLRPHGAAQYAQVRDALPELAADPFVEPGFTRDPIVEDVEVAIFGAGFAGLVAGARMRDAGIDDIRLIDEAGDVGGTWYWNRYPGANCDIESYVYLPLLEETGYIPKHKYSFGPEILEYCRLIARTWDLYRGSCFRTVVTGVGWDDGDARWTISTDRGDRMRARFVVIAAGPMNRPKLPGVPGIEGFAGRMFHTCRWDYGYTGGSPTGGLTGLADKRVGIIGTGATAVQAVPKLAADAGQLYVFQRTPSAVAVRGNRPTDPGWAAGLAPGWQQERMANFLGHIHGGNPDTDLVRDGWTDIFSTDSALAIRRRARQHGREISSAQRQALMEIGDFARGQAVRRRIDDLVDDPATAEALKPWYRPFCKRPCFHDEYLPAFNRSNVTLVDTDGRGVERITPTGAVANGREYPLDCLVLATGFDVNAGRTEGLGCDVVGRGGRTLRERWAEVPSTLHGLLTDGFPNCFFLPGPQSAYSFLIPFAYDEQATHIGHLITEAGKRGSTVVEATPEAVREWSEEVVRSARTGLEFYSDCTPGFYNNEGEVTASNTHLATVFSAGPFVYLDRLRSWRAAGDLRGVTMTGDSTDA